MFELKKKDKVIDQRGSLYSREINKIMMFTHIPSDAFKFQG